MKRRKRAGNLILIAWAAVTATAWSMAGGPRAVELAREGEARAVIVVPEGAMTKDSNPGDFLENIAEIRRQLQQESVEDLAYYLGRMSGVEIEVVENLPADDPRTPIYIGSLAETVFGPVGISKAGTYGFRVVADRRRGIGLYGETEHGTSYAVYELLHRLGCRWYMPTELGEVVPEDPALSVPEMDEKLAPATEFRSMSQGGEDWQRRNRFTRTRTMGRIPAQDINRIIYRGDRVEVAAGHNIVWLLLRPAGLTHRFRNWTDPDVAEAMSDTILSHIEKHLKEVLEGGFPIQYRLNMPDGYHPTEDADERKHDPEPRVWEPAAGLWSVTDRLILLANRILERVTEEHADVHIELLGYVNHSRPPERYEPHPHISWTITPIDFNHHHPMTWPDHPDEDWLLNIVKDWAEKDVRLGAYWYGINLGELSAPCPFITKWGADIPILLEKGVKDWKPETMNGWDTMMPAYYLAARMTFDATESPEEILDEMWNRFYGPAAGPMADYWTGMDKAYIESREYARPPYGYLKIFTPEVMERARSDIDIALDAAGDPDGEYCRRVKLINESFSLFERFMAMRRDWAGGRLSGLDEDYETWRTGVLEMVQRYDERYGTGNAVQGRHANPLWSDRRVRPVYEDGARMERDYERLGEPMLEWKWKHNEGPEENALPWTEPDYDDSEWPVMHVVRDTWSSIGHHNTVTHEDTDRSGRMAYRNAQNLPELPEGKSVYLWFGQVSRSVKVYVNGKHIPYVVPEETGENEKGEVLDRFKAQGDPPPARFEVTDALESGKNRFTVLAEASGCAGGVMGPVVIYRER